MSAPISVNVTQQVKQFWSSRNAVSGDSLLLMNNDIVNTVYVGTAPNGCIIPIGPLGALSVDPTENWYAVGTVAGVSGPLIIAPGGTTWTPAPSLVAASISALGLATTANVAATTSAVAALQATTALVQAGSIGGAAAGTITPTVPYVPLSLANVAGYTSYDINCYVTALSPGTAGAVVAAQVQLQWFDDTTSGIPVFEEDWYIWAGRAAPVAGANTLSGCGPMHGMYLTVTYYIPPGAAANATVQYVNIFGSNRATPYSDWRQNGETVDPQIFNLLSKQGGGLSFENILASASALVLPANETYFIPLGLFAGPVYVRYIQSAAATADPTIVAVAGITGGQFTAGGSGAGAIYDLPNSTPNNQLEFILPRSACMLLVETTAAITISFYVIAQQSA